jgi:hypothetical protein
MDLYLGELSPAEIARQVIASLQKQHRLALEDYRVWVHEHKGYCLLDLDDASRWVLRLGDEHGRHVHVHPGRYSPHTRRVRANVLKTAVLALAHARLHGSDPLERSLLDRVRGRYLNLPPLGRDASGDHGIGAVIHDLR